MSGNGFNTDDQVTINQMKAQMKVDLASGNYGQMTGKAANFNDVLDAVMYGVTGSHSDKDQKDTLNGLAQIYNEKPSEVRGLVESGDISVADIAAKTGMLDNQDTAQRFSAS